MQVRATKAGREHARRQLAELAAVDRVPYFIHTEIVPVLVTGMMSAFFLYLSAIFLTPPRSATASLALGIIGLFWLYIFLSIGQFQVWRANFYSTSVKFGRIIADHEIAYEDIDRIELSAERHGLKTWKVVRLYHGNLNAPILVPGNPRSPYVDENLETWLRSRIVNGSTDSPVNAV